MDELDELGTNWAVIDARRRVDRGTHFHKLLPVSDEKKGPTGTKDQPDEKRDQGDKSTMEEPPMSPLAPPPPSSHDGFRFDQEDLANWIEELDVDSLTEDFMSIEELEAPHRLDQPPDCLHAVFHRSNLRRTRRRSVKQWRHTIPSGKALYQAN